MARDTDGQLTIDTLTTLFEAGTTLIEAAANNQRPQSMGGGSTTLDSMMANAQPARPQQNNYGWNNSIQQTQGPASLPRNAYAVSVPSVSQEQAPQPMDFRQQSIQGGIDNIDDMETYLRNIDIGTRQGLTISTQHLNATEQAVLNSRRQSQMAAQQSTGLSAHGLETLRTNMETTSSGRLVEKIPFYAVDQKPAAWAVGAGMAHSIAPLSYMLAPDEDQKALQYWKDQGYIYIPGSGNVGSPLVKSSFSLTDIFGFSMGNPITGTVFDMAFPYEATKSLTKPSTYIPLTSAN